MTSRERVFAAVRGDPTDRPPFALWRHFFDRETLGAGALAEAMIDWVDRYRFDLLKYNPRANYHAEPWGTRFSYDRDPQPRLLRHAVSGARRWREVRPRAESEPVFEEMREGLRLVRERLPAIPLVMTVFTPLAVCERLAGRDRLLEDLRERPGEVLSALDAVSETFARFAVTCLDAGADGIFLATTAWAQRATLDDESYARFGRPFDLRVLDAVAGAPLNVLHVCGPDARVVELARYPVAAVSWNTHASANPGLREFLAEVPDRAAIGGLSDEALVANEPDRAAREAAACRAETGGRRWIAAGGCTIPPRSTAVAIDAAREALIGSPIR